MDDAIATGIDEIFPGYKTRPSTTPGEQAAR